MTAEWSGRQQTECSGKDCLSPGQARKVAARMQRRNKNQRVSAYHCVTCGSWHVGSAPSMLLRPKGRPRVAGFVDNYEDEGSIEDAEIPAFNGRNRVFAEKTSSGKRTTT